jgi:hypothetical protein
LTVYVGKDVGVVKPKVVRVQYSLKLKEEKGDTYSLMRQESTELDLAQYKNVKSYELIGGIKECTVTFTARVEKKEKKPKGEQPKGDQQKAAPAGKAPAQKKKVVYEYKTSKEWVSEPQKEGDKKEEELLPRIPHSIEIKLVLWDMTHKKHEDYLLFFEIPTDTTMPKQEPKKEEVAAAKQDDKKAEQKSDAKGGAIASSLENLTKLFNKS